MRYSLRSSSLPADATHEIEIEIEAVGLVQGD